MSLPGFALSLCIVALPAPAQLREEKHTPLGVSLEVPRKYNPIPVQPTEPFIVLRYAGESSDGMAQPELYVLRIDWKEDPEPLPDPPPITTFERFVEQRLKSWEVIDKQDGKARPGWTTRVLELEHKPAPDLLEGTESESPLVGWAHELRNEERTWIVLGFCHGEEADKQTRWWRQCAEKMQFFEPTAVAEAKKWRRFYEFHPEFKNPEYRIAVRSRLVEGWDSEDTANFVFVFSTNKDVLMRDVQKKLEGIRKLYVELFPPAAEITAVSTARVCKDDAEYHEYGGSDRTAGYWNSQTEELVFYDGGKEDTRIVLYHEAFHQYIYYAVGEANPHDWFNEGYGDYFSGAEFNTYGDVIRIRPNPWRIRHIKREIGECPSWGELIAMERKEFYDPERAPLNYAMAWSVIYFLEQSKAVKKHPTWSRILPRYFETFKTGWTREKERLEAGGLADRAEEINKAAKTVRQAANAAAFDGVDVREIEKAWSDFVLDLKEPK